MSHHKQPFDDTPSSFVLNCMDYKSFSKQGLALDFACGYGRHTHWLASEGFTVVSCDLAFDGLQTIKKDSENALCVCIDARASLPFDTPLFQLIVVVHYVQKGLLSILGKLLAPGGFLIYETFGGQGENWRFLPVAGELEDELAQDFSVLKKTVRLLGPENDQHLNIKLFAQKNYA
ncbi:MAG: class I SAM-dependent methyltransferase [Methylobacter sp.]|uniref:class I SAM-dependent methyltransferase n=1 Tax=Methylobacter sp. TaxID=2051955 RepID=UPI00272FDA7D|nr:class I SAM-dependent methyltransferase [Methylobacter sp.]MDP1666139.1 class I SAM-dependent methyltransferase [Methylobacter sp.]